MKKAARSFSMLIVVICTSATIAYFAFEKSKAKDLGETDEVVLPLLTFDPSAVTQVNIEHLGERTRLTKTEKAWALEEPYRLSVLSTEVNKWIAHLRNLTPETRFVLEEGEVPNAASTGLESPAYTIRLTAQRSETAPPFAVSIQIGSKNEYNKQVYVRYWIQDEVKKLALISATSASRLAKTWLNFTDRRLAGVTRKDINELAVRLHDPKEDNISFRLLRQKNTTLNPALSDKPEFLVMEPVENLADRETVAEIFLSLYRTPIQDFLTMDHENRLVDHGLEKPLLTVSLKGQVQSNNMKPFSHALLISPAQANGMMRVARTDQSWVVELPTKTFQTLFVTIGDLCSRRLISINRFSVQRVEIHKPKSPPIILEKDPKQNGDGPKWKMLAPIPGHAKTHLVTSLLLAYSNLNGIARVKTIQNPADKKALHEYGLDDPTRVQFFNENKAEMGELWLGGTFKDKAFAMSKNGEIIVTIPISRLNALPSDAASLLEK